MTEKTVPAASHRVGRGRKVRDAVLAATLARLAEAGYAALTVDTVARRAGVNKTTVYRRWKDRESLVVDAITDRIAADVPMPDTGDVGGDLRALARSLVATLTGGVGQAVMTTMLVGAAHVPEIVEIRRRFFDDRVRRAEPLVRRAVLRGELPGDTDPAELVKALIAPIYLRLLVTAEPLDEAVADRAAMSAVAAARAGALSGPVP